MILKPGLIPTQDDPENVRRRGGLRPGADTDAKRRTTQPGADSPVPARQPSDRIYGQNRAEGYQLVQRVLVAQEYVVQRKKQRGAVRAYLSKVTGMSLRKSPGWSGSTATAGW
jgi:hypothetical protein